MQPEHLTLTTLLHRTAKAGAAEGLATRLLTTFGGLGAVLAAAPHRLREVEGMNETGVAFLGAVQEAAVAVAGETVKRRDVMSSWSALQTYLKVSLQHETREQFRVIFLDKRNQIIADEVQSIGTVDNAPVYPREVVRRALLLDASALIIAHNHPSGDPMPSQADIDMTRQVVEAARALRITVHDHVVVGAHGVASFRALGLL